MVVAVGLVTGSGESTAGSLGAGLVGVGLALGDGLLDSRWGGFQPRAVCGGGLAERGANSTAATGRDVGAGVVGAAPMTPVPIGDLAAGGPAAGAPIVKPIMIAKGEPRVISREKVDLGENRTS